MTLYKFKRNDIFINRIKAFPQCDFHIYDGHIYYNHDVAISGSNTSNVKGVPTGHISLYEKNIDRPTGQYIYPFITKEGSLTSFSTVSTEAFNQNFNYGDQLTGSYPMSASISRQLFTQGNAIINNVHQKAKITSLENTLNYYIPLSRHYEYSGTLGNKSHQELNLVSIPSIFYGSSIKKGTVKLDMYITGTLVGRAQDINRNGELVQTLPTGSTGSGSVAGVVLYNEGFLVLTGSWNLTQTTHNYLADASDKRTTKWLYFAAGANDSNTSLGGGDIPSASFGMSFKGTNYIPTLTMMAHAPMGQLNYSNNPTYINNTHINSLVTPATGSNYYVEDRLMSAKNIVSSSYSNHGADYEKTTYISKVGIYDKDKNLIAVAKLANPVRKTQDKQYTFKLKLDI
jgi:hypothetical protein